MSFFSRYQTNEKIKLIKYNPLSKYYYFMLNNNFYRIKTNDINKNEIYIDGKILLEKKIYLVLNTNKVPKNGYCHIISPNYKDTIISYITDINGDEKYDIIFKDILKNKILEIKLPHKITVNYVWSPVENAIFYTISQTNRINQLWYLNIDTKENKLIFEEKHIEYFIWIKKSNDNQYLLINSLSRKTSKCYYYKFISKNKKNRLNKIRIINKKKTGLKYNGIISYKNYFIILTNKNCKSKNFKLMCVPKENTRIKNWFDLTKNDENINISHLICSQDYLILLVQKNGLKNIGIINLKEKITKNKTKEIKYLNFQGPIYYINVKLHNDTNKIIIKYSSYIIPLTYYEYDLEKDNMKVIYDYKLNGYNSELYEIKLLHVPSHDNVNIPISIVYKKEFGKLKDNPRPFILSAYGSYGSLMECSYS